MASAFAWPVLVEVAYHPHPRAVMTPSVPLAVPCYSTITDKSGTATAPKTALFGGHVVSRALDHGSRHGNDRRNGTGAYL